LMHCDVRAGEAGVRGPRGAVDAPPAEEDEAEGGEARAREHEEADDDGGRPTALRPAARGRPHAPAARCGGGGEVSGLVGRSVACSHRESPCGQWVGPMQAVR